MNNNETTMRESFVFYRSFYRSINNVPDEAQLMLYRAVSEYALNQIEPTFPESSIRPFVVAIWEGIRPQLDANMQRYLNGCKGGAPMGNHNNPNGRKGKTNQEPTKNQPNVNDNDNDNDNENVNVNKNGQSQGLILPFEDPEFVSTWDELKQQPKWRGKTTTALQKSLNKLARYDVRFAIELMNTAIANDYQGIVFDSTSKSYEMWQRAHPARERTDTKVITKVEDIFGE